MLHGIVRNHHYVYRELALIPIEIKNIFYNKSYSLILIFLFQFSMTYETRLILLNININIE